MESICSFEGCDRPHYGKGLCNGHWQQQRKGVPLKPLRKSGRRGDSLQERLDLHTDKSPVHKGCWIWTGSKQEFGHGKLRNHETGKTVMAHRLAFELAKGSIPEGMEIDHICHQPSCVRPGHLRITTRKQNNENRKGPQSKSRSGVRGVSRHAGKWRVQVMHNGVTHYGGRFERIEDAEQAAINLRNELFTHSETDKGRSKPVVIAPKPVKPIPTPRPKREPSPSICTFSGCGRGHYAKGLCSAHYQMQRAGKPLMPVQRPTQRVVSLAERLDKLTDRAEGGHGCWMFLGTTARSGHGRIRGDNGTVLAHRVAYELAYGAIPEGALVDHKCRIPGCVRPDHLQLATKVTNGENRDGANPNSKSRVRNVSWSQGAWMVMVQSQGKAHYGGRFKDLAEAERAAIALRKKVFTNSLMDETS